MSVSRELQNYEDSEEERILKNTLKLLSHDFANLVIESCNVLKPASFTNVDVLTQPMNEELQYRASSYRSWHHGDDYTVVRYGQLFKQDLIHDVAIYGIKNVTDECKPAFLAILNFLHEIKYHEEALSALRRVGDKARLTTVMAQHLFCQLVPGKEYLMDNRSKLRHCPCGKSDCKQILKTGCTALGCPETWHGFADIIVNQKIAVSISEKLFTSENEYYDDTEESISSGEDGNTEGGPSEPKQLCIEDNNTCTGKEESLSINVIDQIIALTITNAFSQVSETSALSGWLIPTVGCSMNHVILFLYDPKNDVLLQCFNKIKLWGGTYLRIPSIVQIWMLMNFSVFTHGNLADEYELACSNFHRLAEYRLESYKNMKCRRVFTSGYNSEVDVEALSMMQKFGKTAVKRQKAHFVL